VNFVATGIVTLIVLSVVQVFVIPQVQIRGRRRERWENDVGELRALLEEKLERAHDSLRSAGYQIRYLGDWKENLETNEGGKAYIDEALQAATATFHDARKSIGELMAQMSRIEDRIKLLNPKAAYWGRLNVGWMGLRVAMFAVEHDPSWGGERLDDEAWDAAWDKVRDRREVLLKIVKEVADEMKPPPAHRVRRARQLLARWGQRVALVHGPARPAGETVVPGVPGIAA
jgi:hypothetical protein